MSDSIGLVTQVQATPGTQTPSLASLVAAREAAPESPTNPVPKDSINLSSEAQSTFDDATQSIAQRAQEVGRDSLNPMKQIAKQSTEQLQPTPKSIHVVA
jgi:hypothetical protein